jgi:acyl-CoA synthetase (AMP-forming)/AMP-acid ligase II
MVRANAPSLRARLANAAAEQIFFDRTAQARLAKLVRGTSLGGRLAALAGRSVMVATASQLTAALALIELDGVARRLTILPPDTAPEHLRALVARAEVDAVVVDDAPPPHAAFDPLLRVLVTPAIAPAGDLPPMRAHTEWVLLTSGTSGVPKMAVHDLASLIAPIGAEHRDGAVVWGTFYDIRRYGGLQILLRALIGEGSLVLSHAGEPIADHLARLGRCGVTHLSGTPSAWRRALMSPAVDKIAPRYVRLSGEIADQAILDSLHAAFPQARIGHAYASTEAGVAFEVEDGCAGFPAEYLAHDRDEVELRLADGALRIRSPRTAQRYLGVQAAALRDQDGFVDTGDMVERRGDRYLFVGRRGGIINVGGLKVHPEEIEAVINRHPQVRMSLVRPKRNAVTGAVVIADVVLEPQTAGACAGGELAIKDDILTHCREALPRYKVPAAISIVPALDVAATGKLARRHG